MRNLIHMLFLKDLIISKIPHDFNIELYPYQEDLVSYGNYRRFVARN